MDFDSTAGGNDETERCQMHELNSSPAFRRAYRGGDPEPEQVLEAYAEAIILTICALIFEGIHVFARGHARSTPLVSYPPRSVYCWTICLNSADLLKTPALRR